jgi:hypothetical protein
MSFQLVVGRVGGAVAEGAEASNGEGERSRVSATVETCNSGSSLARDDPKDAPGRKRGREKDFPPRSPN